MGGEEWDAKIEEDLKPSNGGKKKGRPKKTREYVLPMSPSPSPSDDELADPEYKGRSLKLNGKKTKKKRKKKEKKEKKKKSKRGKKRKKDDEKMDVDDDANVNANAITKVQKVRTALSSPPPLQPIKRGGFFSSRCYVCVCNFYFEFSLILHSL